MLASGASSTTSGVFPPRRYFLVSVQGIGFQKSQVSDNPICWVLFWLLGAYTWWTAQEEMHVVRRIYSNLWFTRMRTMQGLLMAVLWHFAGLGDVIDPRDKLYLWTLQMLLRTSCLSEWTAVAAGLEESQPSEMPPDSYFQVLEHLMPGLNYIHEKHKNPETSSSSLRRENMVSLGCSVSTPMVWPRMGPAGGVAGEARHHALWHPDISVDEHPQGHDRLGRKHWDRRRPIQLPRGVPDRHIDKADQESGASSLG
ncbi:hypothetical protein NM208_g7070 [Fusarium decemcellulare]|uniref:Uncharacterized protein n=1 Tax=Fusarium decemcellulare TaxID=57161 RepID=A0ACC1SAL8_9HYPO|nr:hypothetical protein NM208_g7070 [Fusarium decemcellulare]